MGRVLAVDAPRAAPLRDALRRGRRRQASGPQQGAELGGGNQHPLLQPLGELGGVTGRVAIRGALRLRLERGDHGRIDARPQAAVVGRAANQVIVECGAPAVLRRVVRVHVAVDLVEGDARGEGAGGLHRGHGPPRRAGGEVCQGLFRGRQVELVAQAGAPCFEQHREIRQLGHRGHELLGLHPREPQRHPLLEAPACQQQRPPRALAKAGAEEPARLHGVPQERVEVHRRHPRHERVGVEVRAAARDDGVVVRLDVGRRVEALPPSGRQRQRDGAVHLAAPRGVQHHMPLTVRTRVAARRRQHLLHQHMLPMRQRCVRRFPLPREEIDQLGGGDVVKAEPRAQMAK